MRGEYCADALFTPSHFNVDDIGHCLFLKFCYKFKRKCVGWTLCNCTVYPLMFYCGRYCLLFFRFAINLRGKILNSVEFMVRVHPTGFIVATLFTFLKKKKYFLFFCFYFLILILILFIFIFIFIFILIPLLSFMLFRKPIWNDDYF